MSRISPKAYYHYGEGSVWHPKDGSRPCEFGFPGRHHPAVQRSEWPSRRAYLFSEVCRWLWDRFWAGKRVRYYKKGGESYYTFGLVGNWLMSQGLKRVPTVWMEFKPIDSIYELELPEELIEGVLAE